ncbi:SDR family oxidoreductase [Extensimonas sp. H3M7-6]|uniref:SDR family oxidoreductase n=1 Tax=Extensimonas soli TaxID=3031322 RepID=UPI0019B31178|nr:SDR family oxidoreductase [Extensimonas sp. H3M7-6]MBC7214595.1 SDR family oxidoreductase [Burkholderiaceae bacterium]MDF1481618.1 SDR family oxidoreductase [Extensimonas sp. H3M7-6]
MNTQDTTQPKFGPGDEALAALPTVYRDDLFAGKVVLVSGAGSGIGKAIAFLFARLGATLAICGRNAEKLEDSAQKLRALSGREVFTYPMTIRDPEQVDALMGAVWEHFGGLDILVNNAGGQFAAHAMDFPIKGWNAVIDTNLNGSWFMMQSAAKRWVEQGKPGNIINITAAIDRGLTGMAHTAASRAGVIALSRTLAIEWAEHNIRLNCIGAGAIESNGFNNYRDENVPTFYQCNPMMRPGDVQDIAEAVVYLAGPSGKFITGEVLNVEGGMLLWGDFWPAGKPDYFKVNGA